MPNPVSSRPLYSGSGSSSLCRLACRLSLVAAAASLAFAGGGCSYQLGSLFDKNKEQAAKEQVKAETTGSVLEIPAKRASDGDLAYARAAAAEVLRRGGEGVSQPWENPETGARGTVTPIASAYSVDGFTCHDFLASYIRRGSQEDWMRGEACRIHQGRWEVRRLQPWKSP
jgi:surface antigen